MNNIIEVSNQLIEHYVGVMRDIKTSQNDFENAIEKITYLMSYQITKDIELVDKKICTPLCETTVRSFDDNILLIPVLRAGLPIFETIKKMFPYATFGFLGMKRNVKNNTADMFFNNLPDNLMDYKIYILDVVIATGSTLLFILNYFETKGIKQENITIVNILASRKGIENVRNKFPYINIFTCKIDEVLTDEGMIIPGLGDAGDRLNGYKVME